MSEHGERSTPAPRISVVIPTYNRRRTLARVLRAYELQEPRELAFEVVVVDDGSEDGTPELLAGLTPRRYRLRHNVEANGGPARARNRGLARARGELVVFTGDDIEPAPELLAEHLAGHDEADDPGLAVLGLTRWPREAETTATMRHIDGPGAQQFSYHYFRDGEEYDFRHFYTSNISVRRSLLDREGAYFSEDFPAAAFEDAEYAYRLARHGLRIRYRRSAEAYHHHHYGAKDFFRRQERCGEMAVLLYGKFPELRRYLDLTALERARLALLAPRPAAVRRLEAAAAELPAWEARALALATFFDPLAFGAIDEWLRPLFRYGYLKGLAAATYPPPTARQVLASFFLDLLPPAAAAFRYHMDQAGHPYPLADLRALEGLLPSPQP